MTNEEAIDELSVIYERLSHPDDCGKGVYSFSDGDYLEALDMAIKALEQEPKTGHWILLDECSNSGYYCSECHKKVIKEGWSNTVKKVKYCPNCGARMIESEE